MATRRMPVVFLLGACAAACGQDPAPWVARLSPLAPGEVAVVPAAPPVTELPPFLEVPCPAPVAPRRHCLPCPNTTYNPNFVYLPDRSPDWGAGSCDGECRPCRVSWVSADFLCVKTRPLDDEVDRRTSYGCRVGGGHWFGPDRTLGVEASMFHVRDKHRSWEPGPTLIDSPIAFTSAEASGRAELMAGDRWGMDGIAGYRYVRLEEELTLINPAFITDIEAGNEIHMAQVGVIAGYRFGAYFHEWSGKLASGRNAQTVTTNGVRATDGVLSVLGEFGVRCGYQLGEGCWGMVGLTALYLTNVERPGRSEGTDFYLFGLTVGIEKRF